MNQGDIQEHYAHLEQEHQDTLNAPPPNHEPLNIMAERIIQEKNNDFMKLLTNFITSVFLRIYNTIESELTPRRHRYAVASPKTKMLITLCPLKHNEPWVKMAVFYGVSTTYCYNIAVQIIGSCHKLLKEEFIRWISVADRVSKYNQRYQDYPTLLGSLDANVQRISRPKTNQQEFYSGKHKCHVIKVQGLVSPVGLLIHFTRCVPCSVHDF